MDVTILDTLYENPLASEQDVREFRMEGDGAVSFPAGRMRLEGLRDPDEGQAANIVFWGDQTLPDDILIEWDFQPIREPGLCIFFFAAMGHDGRDVLDPSLAPRTGPYEQYHHGDINALHVSYFRRKHPGERAFNVCNLRKSYGFHMVAQGPDPIPSVPDAAGPYHIQLLKAGPHVRFAIGKAGKPSLTIFHWTDPQTHGPALGPGRFAFRQMTPLIGEYANLVVRRVAWRDPT